MAASMAAPLASLSVDRPAPTFIPPSLTERGVAHLTGWRPFDILRTRSTRDSNEEGQGGLSRAGHGLHQGIIASPRRGGGLGPELRAPDEPDQMDHPGGRGHLR